VIELDFGPLEIQADPVALRALAERREMLRRVYVTTIERADAGMKVDPTHLALARSFVAANAPLDDPLGTGEPA
jgi:hypothetical protein